MKHALPKFGNLQDAVLNDNAFLYHAVISPYLDVGLLDPLEVCQAVEAAWKAGDVPIDAAGGFSPNHRPARICQGHLLS
ncbi:MAG: hypothetical protein ABJL99_20125 [Aliishimia sp.]